MHAFRLVRNIGLLATLTLSACATAGDPGEISPARSSLHLVDPSVRDVLREGFGASSWMKGIKTPEEWEAIGGPTRYRSRSIPGLPGEPEVRIVIVEPRNPQTGRPGLLEIHGGGYVTGSADQMIPMVAPLAEEFGMTVVSVDYRIAPATQYPGSLHDNYAALKWFHDNAPRLGVDPQRIGVYGVSAGGGHAAALSLFARDKAEVPIALQVLRQPMLDDRTAVTVDPGPYAGEFIWTRERNTGGWRALLGAEPGGPDVPTAAVPARASALAGLPPTFISVGALDLFAAESIQFARRLMQAGVPTELHVYPGAIHGWQLLSPEAAISQESEAAVRAALRRAFSREAP